MPGGRANRRLRTLLVALAALAAGLALGACGGGDDGDDPTTTGADTGTGSQFTSAEFAKTLDAVNLDAGTDAELLQVQIAAGGTDYQIRDGKKATGLHFDVGSADPQEVDVTVVADNMGADKIAFPLGDIDPAAIDVIVAAAPEASGVDDFTITVMTLHRTFPKGDVEWTINGDGGGRTGIVLTAKPDGSGLTTPGGEVPGEPPPGAGTGPAGGPGAPPAGQPPTPPSAEDIKKIGECIQNSGGDQAKIQDCIQQ